MMNTMTISPFVQPEYVTKVELKESIDDLKSFVENGFEDFHTFINETKKETINELKNHICEIKKETIMELKGYIVETRVETIEKMKSLLVQSEKRIINALHN